MRRAIIGAAATLCTIAPGSTAHAWAETGHRLISQAAVEALPPELPAFLRTPEAAAEIGELSREPDRWRGAGRVHDAERDPAHFIDVDDQGRVLGGPALAELPATRAEYEAALRVAGQDPADAGYLPYAIVDGWQQLAKDFAYWRALKAAEPRERNRERRAWLRADRLRREQLILRDLGIWSHYVGDASQPMHVSVHFNGWGDHPNPEGFTRAKIHGSVEGPFVRDNARIAAVRAAVKPFASCDCPIEDRTMRYLQASWRQVAPLYRLEKAGAFMGTDPRGAAFVSERLAAAASELRDMVIEAWRASARLSVGYPALKVVDIEAGRVDPYQALYGRD